MAKDISHDQAEAGGGTDNGKKPSVVQLKVVGRVFLVEAEGSQHLGGDKKKEKSQREEQGFLRVRDIAFQEKPAENRADIGTEKRGGKIGMEGKGGQKYCDKRKGPHHTQGQKQKPAQSPLVQRGGQSLQQGEKKEKPQVKIQIPEGGAYAGSQTILGSGFSGPAFVLDDREL